MTPVVHYLEVSGHTACRGLRVVRDDRPPEKRTYVTNFADQVTCPTCKAALVLRARKMA